MDAARAILRAILAERPDDPEARLLLEGLRDLPGTGVAEREEELLAPLRPARASEIRGRFQAALGGGEAGETRRVRRRLEAFLARVRESRGVTGAR